MFGVESSGRNRADDVVLGARFSAPPFVNWRKVELWSYGASAVAVQGRVRAGGVEAQSAGRCDRQ